MPFKITAPWNISVAFVACHWIWPSSSMLLFFLKPSCSVDVLQRPSVSHLWQLWSFNDFAVLYKKKKKKTHLIEIKYELQILDSLSLLSIFLALLWSLLLSCHEVNAPTALFPFRLVLCNFHMGLAILCKFCVFSLWCLPWPSFFASFSSGFGKFFLFSTLFSVNFAPLVMVYKRWGMV